MVGAEKVKKMETNDSFIISDLTIDSCANNIDFIDEFSKSFIYSFNIHSKYSF